MGTKPKYPIGERAKDYSIKLVSLLFGTVHFTARLAADGAREAEADLVHLIDNGTDKEIIRLRRDKAYDDKIQDLRNRMGETLRVMGETYERMTRKMSTEELVAMEGLMAPLPPQS